MLELTEIAIKYNRNYEGVSYLVKGDINKTDDDLPIDVIRRVNGMMLLLKKKNYIKCCYHHLFNGNT